MRTFERLLHLLVGDVEELEDKVAAIEKEVVFD